MTTPSAAPLPVLQELRPSRRMPVLFVGHGSPMNAVEDNVWRRAWQELGRELLGPAERPQLILCISAHWLTPGGWYLTGMAQPRTIHDFGGFPPVLYAQQYPAPGAPQAAQALAAALRSPATGKPLGVDDADWGLDHGAWSILLPMFPVADIPVLELSMDFARPPAEHYALGRQLRAWRERGVLIVGSGNVVHHLGAMRAGAGINATYTWAAEFDARVTDLVKRGDLDALAGFAHWGEGVRMAHPTHEHFLPLLYAAGAVHPGEAVRFFNTGFQAASISMRSMAWGMEL
ncbi:MAG: 4,5-DOPA dioxygenase extradiol [Burkholderiales bacterium 68-12]|nr:MAG: 4,5-DOPA dioxygenase extradiol [Burkholderiales bacterium 68-12]